ncbi:MAG TPA: response regulator [Myxococcales bacterium]|jgi:CheY-like chemotaxis protein
MNSHYVMIVDDDRDVRESLAEVLEDHGYPSVAAANGQEALDRLRSVPTRPCLILLDLMMPIMDGRQFRAQQQQDEVLGMIPVLVFSAHTNVEEASAALGASACLRKPIELPLLLEAVRALCPPQPQ